MSEPQILFVCTGNTCRSAMAEALWRTMGHNRGSSAGVSAWSGQEPSRYAIEAVKLWEADLTSHRARDLDEVKDSPDLIVTMTHSQARAVVVRRPEWESKTFQLHDLVGEHGEIRDPIGQKLEQYVLVAREIHRLLEKLHHEMAQDPMKK